MADRDETNGRFLPGNRFWEARSSAGPKPKFAGPDELWAACVEYFVWCEENPLHEAKAFAYEGVVKVEALPKLRAMTIGGLCLFLDITEECWRGWKTKGHDQHRSDLLGVITQAEAVIYQQKFTGAAADLLNPNIIARDLGLADRKELTGQNGGPIRTITETMTPQEAAEAYAATLHGNEG
jgi:hypothetical protein